ncbi:hypothetical protein HELRODRAFT_191587 [Helobdella robusta]|uniref:Xrn1 N-terminal domain-containing protein n=1 Tax=Helobdella robusta TaxID=6412 RepID=T1FT39_HELRO|nr:hypothetical protein HELRODRAFT_191587 [Helobdella robusta]ESO05087.1 hypothetical protein HELRODRAFT_191587 [Helobdella robusta]
MGVPAFFRWLSRKYSSIVVHAKEDKQKIIDGVQVPIDITQPNPNNVEFDNLYLDMNGIIHPCCHPENKPAPKNEDEMMVLIFEYIDRLMAIVRPRKLLYMAIDGVAPRAKMNQQRSRRFRASKDSRENREEIAKVKEEMREKGLEVPADKPASEHFDSNCITPGTPFMSRLADCLRYYIHLRINNDPGWSQLMVILSDANAPGEGEHKIMDFIRRQRAQSDHDPNTHHCLCGADADLIMLGLATHEPNFTIIREEFKPNAERACEICGGSGHQMKECMGLTKVKSVLKPEDFNRNFQGQRFQAQTGFARDSGYSQHNNSQVLNRHIRANLDHSSPNQAFNYNYNDARGSYNNNNNNYRGGGYNNNNYRGGGYNNNNNYRDNNNNRGGYYNNNNNGGYSFNNYRGGYNNNNNNNGDGNNNNRYSSTGYDYYNNNNRYNNTGYNNNNYRFSSNSYPTDQRNYNNNNNNNSRPRFRNDY